MKKSVCERMSVQATLQSTSLHLLSICLQLTCSPLQLQLPLSLPPSFNTSAPPIALLPTPCIFDTVTSSSLSAHPGACVRKREKKEYVPGCTCICVHFEEHMCVGGVCVCARVCLRVSSLLLPFSITGHHQGSPPHLL